MTDDDREIDGFLQLLRNAEETIEQIESAADADDLGPALSLLDDLEDIVDEAEDVLSTLDLAEVVEAINWGNLPNAVELEEIPDALDDGDLDDSVALRELIDLADLPQLFESVDEREFWREKREFGDELDDVVGDDSESPGSDPGFDVDVDADSGADDVASHEIDPQAIQMAVQSEIIDAVGEFRATLLAAHERLDSLRQENEERFDRKRTRSSSRSPTASFSTMSTGHVGMTGKINHSTVPEETRYSTAPNRKRIYGNRFKSAEGNGHG